jgi:NAD(P)H-dependent FMN reductase
VTRIAIILGSTRPGRRGEAVAKWVLEHAAQRGDATYELVDVAAYDLPLLDEPTPASQVAAGAGEYTKPHTKKWSATIASFDAFVFVTGEHNASMPAAIKNAIDFLYKEWNNKAAAFVSYGGGASGTRAVAALRIVMAGVQIAAIPAQVALSLVTNWENFTTFKPGPAQVKQLATTLDQLVAWSAALQQVRARA